MLETSNPDPSDDSWFGIECPVCSREVIANKEDVATLAVCPHCWNTMTVPHWGTYLQDASRSKAKDSVQALHESADTRCPQCQNLIPIRAQRCPVCGAKTEAEREA